MHPADIFILAVIAFSIWKGFRRGLVREAIALLGWVAGIVVLSLACGLVGLFLPLLPTVPFVLLAAACFSRGSARLEAWLLAHRRCGPWVHAWRANRAVPLWRCLPCGHVSSGGNRRS